jgi:hypothetical protein
LIERADCDAVEGVAKKYMGGLVMQRSPERALLNVAKAILRFVDERATNETKVLFETVRNQNPLLIVISELTDELAAEMQRDAWLRYSFPVFIEGEMDYFFACAVYLAVQLAETTYLFQPVVKRGVCFARLNQCMEMAFELWWEEFLDMAGVPHE